MCFYSIFSLFLPQQEFILSLQSQHIHTLTHTKPIQRGEYGRESMEQRSLVHRYEIVSFKEYKV